MKLTDNWRYKVIFSYILISTLVNIFLIARFLWGNFGFLFEFDSTVTTILSVLGVFITFTAINIYSVFNVQVNSEKFGLEGLRNECDRKIKEINELYEKLNKNDIDLEASFFDIKLTSYSIDIANNKISLVDRVTFMSKLISLIEATEKEIENNNQKDRELELVNSLISLKCKIDERLCSYYKKLDKEKNPYFINVYSKLKEKLK